MNADRFVGFANIYENTRPSVPQYPVDAICRYLGRTPGLVIDMGCGTGLSSKIWEGACSETIGIEPSNDMYTVAKEKEISRAKERIKSAMLLKTHFFL